jgi:two-component system chemotaxis sensor kinase CheA
LQGFVPAAPVFDPSIGLDMYREFILESREHLVAAEQSILALEHSPNDKEFINILFRAFHTIKGVAGFMQLNDLRVLTHDTETMMDLARQGKLEIDQSISEVLLQALDATRVLIDKVSDMAENNGVFSGDYCDVSSVLLKVREVTHPFTQAASPSKLGEILVRQGAVFAHEIDAAVKMQEDDRPEQKLGEILIEQGAATRPQVAQALQEQQRTQNAPLAQSETTIKISSDKLDTLIDMVGELVISGTLVTQNPSVAALSDQRLHKDISLLSRTIRELQNVAMSMRLVPIKPVFQKMIRVVRDITKKNNKDIDIVFSGENTEIDKNIVDMLNDPLMHMVRNSCDHGVETPEERIAVGKQGRGTILLSAAHRSGAIVIEIRDDGRGLNKEKIVRKAMEKRLITGADRMTDNEIYNLIFMPGFSTADTVTDVSGRGVGMDVVKRNIDLLRGKIEIETEAGKGTVFSIKLPLTLAIIDGIVLRSGNERYIVPIYSLTEFFDVSHESIVTVAGQGELFDVHGKMLRVIDLQAFFENERRPFTKKVACIVESQKGLVCVLVDELIGQQQVVIKPLTGAVSDVDGISGSAILGDGRVGLILDVNGIVEKA